MKDPTERFSDSVEDYTKWRPSYPPELTALLRDRCGLAPPAVIADIGSGTGILTRLLLEQGYRVYGVEPNGPMREAAERLLADVPGFTSVEGRAEATGLPPDGMDCVTTAQAFHWFDRALARTEFERILRPNGWVVLVWNERRTGASAFQQAYEDLLCHHAVDYDKVRHTNVTPEQIGEFFRPGSCASAKFGYRQRLDLEGLKGRLSSTSYAPKAGEPGHPAMMAELSRVFAAHQGDGIVTLDYDTRVHYGRFHSAT